MPVCEQVTPHERVFFDCHFEPAGEKASSALESVSSGAIGILIQFSLLLTLM